MLRYLILAIIMSSTMLSHAQENINMIEILNIEQDIVFLENRITSLIKKKPELANIQGLRQYHIFWLSSYTHKKEDFLNYSFLHQLVRDYLHFYSVASPNKRLSQHFNVKYRFKKRNYLKKTPKYTDTTTYINASTMITDSTGNLLARGDACLVSFALVFEKNNIELAKMFFDGKIDFAFFLKNPFRIYICVKDSNLFIIETSKEGLEVYTWEEFMECCFDEWINPSKKQE